MRAVDSELNPSSDTTALDELEGKSFICHRCERVFKGVVDELLYVVEADMTYHEHREALFRAFVILEDGTVQIGAFDSVEENVIQRYRLDRPGAPASGESLWECSRRFFDSMRAKNRKVKAGEISIRFL